MTTPLSPRPVALITGAGRRIGRAIAIELAKAGFDAGLHYRASRAEADELVALYLDAGACAVAVPADLANADDVARLVADVAGSLGPVSCLINNASEFEDDTLASMTIETWTRHIDVNLRAPVMLAQAVAAQVPPGERGNIINIIDQRVLRPTPEFFSYAVSKSGLWAATRTMAQALAPNIRVNAIGPGPVLASVHQTAADFEAEKASTLLKCGVEPEAIAAAVRFILSQPAMTGQMIALDGGQHLTWQA